MAVIDGQDQRGEWLTVRQAAIRLGVSERTLYRRVHDGTLRTRETVAGREVWTPLSEMAGDARPVSGTDDEERALVLVERFAMLTERQAGPLLERLEALARENGRLQARVTELEARLSTPDTGQAAPDTAPACPHSAQDATQASNLGAEAPDPPAEPSDPPVEPPSPLAPDPLPPTTDVWQPRPNISGLRGRFQSCLMACAS